ncbi:EAL and HDOD domain-containing protein [Aquisalimonas asiatica]|uniref:EAL and modified HD-GYP domain-containing signal transduction protein n=1 Tax=Aquisalimonas asiatica TaxID=406100 RepID=A0A1H8SLA6_9GAMM|nr:HDOD domain-containing protein [Aquisalimonas asiatica]SEO79729.1 EAL and modified HD-GYP domain-containing signal transduction protein [Aquisalimonas asiatica]
MTNSANADDIMVGRQPIYDRKLNTWAYELLFRETDQNLANVTDGDRATSQVLYNAFVEIGIEAITGRKKAFVNLTTSFIHGHYPLPSTPDLLVLEVLEDVEPSERLHESIAGLKARGYQIALDDFIYSPNLAALVELADIVKIDITRLTRDELEAHVGMLSRPGLLLLAEKVETQEEYRLCSTLGFDLFQGYFFCKPNIVKGKKIANNRLSLLQLLAVLQSDDVSVDHLESLITQDVTLSYRLLRLINSPHFPVARDVDSVRNALMLLGPRNLRSWVSLLALSGVKDKPDELVRTASVRARMAETLGRETGDGPGAEAFFTAGLFSTLDALTDRPMAELVAELPLSKPLVDALLDRSGAVGRVLQLVIDYERGDWDRVQLNDGGVAARTLRDSYLEAVAWAEEMATALVEEPVDGA